MAWVNINSSCALDGHFFVVRPCSMASILLGPLLECDLPNTTWPRWNKQNHEVVIQLIHTRSRRANAIPSVAWYCFAIMTCISIVLNKLPWTRTNCFMLTRGGRSLVRLSQFGTPAGSVFGSLKLFWYLWYLLRRHLEDLRPSKSTPVPLNRIKRFDRSLNVDS